MKKLIGILVLSFVSVISFANVPCCKDAYAACKAAGFHGDTNITVKCLIPLSQGKHVRGVIIDPAAVQSCNLPKVPPGAIVKVTTDPKTHLRQLQVTNP
ncbi:MAG: hypothetical protein P4M14_00075 [Gammaproteobacteria bacterium]|nr:hypothetical protein [Gammaproteobacteria bacterium]